MLKLGVTIEKSREAEVAGVGFMTATGKGGLVTRDLDDYELIAQTARIAAFDIGFRMRLLMSTEANRACWSLVSRHHILGPPG